MGKDYILTEGVKAALNELENAMKNEVKIKDINTFESFFINLTKSCSDFLKEAINESDE